MKLKIVVITIIGAALTILIYNIAQNHKINLLALGDGIASGMTAYNVNGYSYNDYLKEEYKNNHKLNKYYEFASTGKTVKELIYEIKDNKTINI